MDSVAPVLSLHPDERRLEYDYTILFYSAIAYCGDGEQADDSVGL
jgi:hypothetical protein